MSEVTEVKKAKKSPRTIKVRTLIFVVAIYVAGIVTAVVINGYLNSLK